MCGINKLRPLMQSLDNIVNDSSISDNDYVYVKKGRAHVEGGSHVFTRMKVNAQTIRQIYSEVKARYGEKVGQAVFQDFVEFSGGLRQLQMKDLRHIFQTAEALKLQEMYKQIRVEHGGNFDDMFTPIADEIRLGRTVTRPVLVNSLAQKFGHNIARLATADLGHSLSSLSELVKRATELRSFTNLPIASLTELDLKTLENFCNSSRSKAEMTKIFTERFGEGFATQAINHKVMPEEDIPFNTAFEVFCGARLAKNRADITEFFSNLGDNEVAESLGYRAFLTAGEPLSQEKRNTLALWFQNNKKKADELRRLIEDMTFSLCDTSAGFNDFVKQLVSKHITEGKFSTKNDVEEIQQEITTRYAREKSFDYALQYELDHHAGWTEQQRSLFQNTMTFLHNAFPQSELFFSSDCWVSKLESLLDGCGEFNIYALKDPQTFLQALSLTDYNTAPLLLEHLDKLSVAFQQGQNSAQDISRIIFGENMRRLPACSTPDELHAAFALRYERTILNAYVAKKPGAQQVFDDTLAQLTNARPDGQSDEEFERQLCDKLLENHDIDHAYAPITTSHFGGVRLDAAVQGIISKGQSAKGQSVDLSSLLVPPSFSSRTLNTIPAVMAQWERDFHRQGTYPSNERLKTGGATVITIQTGKNEVVSVNNDSTGLSDAELNGFNNDKELPQHKAVLDSLLKLCDNNEKQVISAIAALSQAGLVSLNKMFANCVSGCDAEGEHSPLHYRFEKDAQNNLVLTAQTPPYRYVAKLNVRLIIHPDGSKVCEAMSMTPPPTRDELIEELAKKFDLKIARLTVAGLGPAVPLAELARQAEKLRDNAVSRSDRDIKVLEDCFKENRSRAEVVKVFTARFGEAIAKRVIPAETFPKEGYSLDEVLTTLQGAMTLENRSAINAFIRDSLKGDEDVAAFLGLKKMWNDGLPLSQEKREAIVAQFAEAKPKADKLREFIDAMTDSLSDKSDGFKTFVKQRVKESIASGKLDDVENLQHEIIERYVCEKSYDHALLHELEQHDKWTDHQRSLFQSTMDFLHKTFPESELFFTSPDRVSMLVKILDGRDVINLSAIKDQETFLKTLSLTGTISAPFLMEHQDELSASFKAGKSSVSDICRIIFAGSNVMPIPQCSTLIDLESAFDRRYYQALRNAYAAQSKEFKQNFDTARNRLAAERTDDMSDDAFEQMVETTLGSQYERALSSIGLCLSSGLKLSAAVQRYISPDQPLQLGDFSIPPTFSCGATTTVDMAMVQWIEDFQRQGEVSLNRSENGATVITIKTGNGEPVSVHNGSNGLTEAELKAFNNGEEISRHRTVRDTLRNLCGNNETQVVTALTALTQSGPALFNKTFENSISDCDSGLEHAPLHYTFEKDGDNLILTAQTPPNRYVAQLDIRIAIHPDGSTVCERLSMTPPMTHLAQEFGAGVVRLAAADLDLKKPDLQKLKARVAELSKNAHIAMDSLTERDLKMLEDFCRGNRSKADLTKAFTERFDQAIVRKVIGAAELPEAGALELDKALELMKGAKVLENRNVIDKFIREELQDSEVAESLGLKQLREEGAPLTKELRDDILARFQTAKAKADELRQLIVVMMSKLRDGSASFNDFVKQLVTGHITGGKFSTEDDVREIQQEITTRYMREKSYDYALQYELDHHPDWTEQQRSLFTGTMNFLHQIFPQSDLFTTDLWVSQLEKLLEGRGEFNLYALKDPQTFLQALSLVSYNAAPLLLEHLDKLSVAFQNGQNSAQDVSRIIFGKDMTPLPQCNTPGELRKAFGWRYDKTVLDAYAAQNDEVNARFTDLRNSLFASRPGNISDEEFQHRICKQTKAICPPQVFNTIATSHFNGLPLKEAVQRCLSSDRPIDLATLFIRPKFSSGSMTTIDQAMGQWVKDFHRQKSNEAAARITVKLPGETVTVHNGSDGSSPEELAAFNNKVRTARHDAVLDALKKLCDGNETQVITAIAALSQSGPVRFNHVFKGLIKNIDDQGEHAPLHYAFELDDKKNLVLTATTPPDLPVAKLDVRLVIHPDGTAAYEKMSLTPHPDAKPEQLAV